MQASNAYSLHGQSQQKFIHSWQSISMPRQKHQTLTLQQHCPTVIVILMQQSILDCVPLSEQRYWISHCTAQYGSTPHSVSHGTQGCSDTPHLCKCPALSTGSLDRSCKLVHCKRHCWLEPGRRNCQLELVVLQTARTAHPLCSALL